MLLSHKQENKNHGSIYSQLSNISLPKSVQFGVKIKSRNAKHNMSNIPAGITLSKIINSIHSPYGEKSIVVVSFIDVICTYPMCLSKSRYNGTITNSMLTVINTQVKKRKTSFKSFSISILLKKEKSRTLSPAQKLS